MPFQKVFEFEAGGQADGYAKWVVVRQMAAEEAARRLNLPLGHDVEVWLRGGIRLRGKLRLVNEMLFVEEERMHSLPLILDGVEFTYAEMESCLRLD